MISLDRKVGGFFDSRDDEKNDDTVTDRNNNYHNNLSMPVRTQFEFSRQAENGRRPGDSFAWVIIPLTESSRIHAHTHHTHAPQETYTVLILERWSHGSRTRSEKSESGERPPKSPPGTPSMMKMIRDATLPKRAKRAGGLKNAPGGFWYPIPKSSNFL